MRTNSTQFDGREEWLAGRNDGIGASEAAAVVGLSSWQSAYGLWVAKTEPPTSDPLDELQYWGLRLEQVIADEFWERAKDVIRND